MQNRYVADVGDFGKYGLLRALVRGESEAPPYSLAVLWYLVLAEELTRDDGKHRGYLRREQEDQYRCCDPELYDALQDLNKRDRSVAAVAQRAVLPGARYHTAPLTSTLENEGPHPSRSQWFAGALEIAKGADLVFVDPDNGLLPRSVSPRAGSAHKYVFVDELAALSRQGASLVVYHHLDRTPGTAIEKVSARAKELEGALSRSCRAVLFRRGTLRAFFVLPTESHRGEIDDRLDRFAHSWSKHVKVLPRSIEC